MSNGSSTLNRPATKAQLEEELILFCFEGLETEYPEDNNGEYDYGPWDPEEEMAKISSSHWSHVHPYLHVRRVDEAPNETNMDYNQFVSVVCRILHLDYETMWGHDAIDELTGSEIYLLREHSRRQDIPVMVLLDYWFYDGESYFDDDSEPPEWMSYYRTDEVWYYVAPPTFVRKMKRDGERKWRQRSGLRVHNPGPGYEAPEHSSDKPRKRKRKEFGPAKQRKKWSGASRRRNFVRSLVKTGAIGTEEDSQ